MKYFCHLTALLSTLGLVSQGFSATVANDPLAAIVNVGVSKSLTVKNSELTLRSTRNTQANTWSSLLPTLSATAARTSSTSQSVSGGAITQSGSTANSLSVAGAWTLFDNYSAIRNIEIASLGTEAQRVTSLQDVNKYVLSVITATLDRQLLLTKRESLKVLLEQARRTKEQSDTLVHAGAKTKFEAMDADIDVMNNERNQMENEIELAAADRNLRVTLNADESVTLPEFDLLKLKPYFLDGFEEKLARFRKGWQIEAQSLNPDLVVSQLSLKKSLLSLKQTRLDYFPKTSLALSQTWTLDRMIQDPNDGGPRSALSSTSLTLQFAWTFWDWFSTPRNIENSEMSYQISTNNYLDSYRKTKSDIQNLFERWDIINRSIESTALVVKKAENQLEYAREMFRMGRITLLEMQQASTRLFDARGQLADRLKTKYLLAGNILIASGENLLPEGTKVPWLPALNVKSAAAGE